MENKWFISYVRKRDARPTSREEGHLVTDRHPFYEVLDQKKTYLTFHIAFWKKLSDYDIKLFEEAEAVREEDIRTRKFR